MVKRKIKILYQSDFSIAKTGFGRISKAILTYLYKTGKYDIVHYCCGVSMSHPERLRTPWKSIGCLPDFQHEMEALQKDEKAMRLASYGAHNLDNVIKAEKPDVYFAVQDWWGVDFCLDKPWYKKINSIIWTTLDSLPILPPALDRAKDVKNYWIWSDFATKELHRLGHKHVKTVHGPIDDAPFFRLKNFERLQLRNKHNIPLNAFIVGFVFRNQLRKSVPNLLEGYKMWKDRNPTVKDSFLLLHTHFGEGWNIHKLADEYKVDKNEILTTYICQVCKQYDIRPFTGQDAPCHHCKHPKSQVTTNVTCGVSEEQLNEIYNLMDVYCHPFTSGGQEIPIQEAKLTELITLVTNYSCGEELCVEGAGSLVLDWAEYREQGTEFRKASTLPSSIAKQLEKVHKMSPEKRLELGRQAREWTLKNYSIKVIGPQIEAFIDSCGYAPDDAFTVEGEAKNPNAIIPEIEDNGLWVKTLYKEILKSDVSETDSGYLYWMQCLANKMPRRDIENYFRQVATKDNENLTKKPEFGDWLDNTGRKRFLFMIKESVGDIFLASSLLKSCKEQYPDHDIYVGCDPQYLDMFDGNPYVYKVIPYVPEMESETAMTGMGSHKGYFDAYTNVALATQKILNYLTNNNIALNLKD
jgi:glycosyltransferase involved in cell wall biosynthesis